MLTAIAKGKAGRISIPGSEVSVSWRDVFRRREDLMTAAFFGRMRYLSDNGINRVLGILIGQEAADSLGTILNVEFWPHLTGLTDRSWVEPDVLLQFESGLLLIEVKPPFGGGQYLKQWQAEVHSLVEECRNGERITPDVVHFLALGRNDWTAGKHQPEDFDTGGCFELFIHTREWETILAAIPTWTYECLRTDAAVFEDWMLAFELFGLHDELIVSWDDLLERPLPELSLAPLTWWPTLNSECTMQAEHLRVNGESHWVPLLQYAQDNPLEFNAWK